MHEQFDVVEFVRYLRRYWRSTAACCGVAVLLAFIVSLVLPKRFTATASLVIEAPTGNDPRAVTVVSPVYLESLKTYERIAASDTLFREAVVRLKVPGVGPSTDIGAFKHRVLKVSKPINTIILEISATLADPRKAQQLAQYIAEKTVSLSKTLDASSEEEITAESRRLLSTAESRLGNAQKASQALLKSEPTGPLETELSNAGVLKLRIQEELLEAKADLGEYVPQQRGIPRATSSEDGTSLERRIAALNGRVATLERQELDLSRLIDAHGRLVQRLKAQRAALETELEEAEADYEAANTKLNEIRVSGLFRAERLQVVDPGIAPRKPSSPNVSLNLFIAAALSLLGAVVYRAVRFTYPSVPYFRPEPSYSLR